MTAWHGLWFVLPVRRGKGLTFQFQSFSCGYAVCSGRFLAWISWSVSGAMVSEGCLIVGDYSLHFCAWSQLASYFWWAFVLLGLDCGCCFLLPSFASWSATSFLCMPVCAGIHWSTAVVLDVRLFKHCIKHCKVEFLMRVIAVQIGSLWGAQPSLVLSPAGWQSLSRWGVLVLLLCSLSTDLHPVLL